MARSDTPWVQNFRIFVSNRFEIDVYVDKPSNSRSAYFIRYGNIAVQSACTVERSIRANDLGEHNINHARFGIS